VSWGSFGRQRFAGEQFTFLGSCPKQNRRRLPNQNNWGVGESPDGESGEWAWISRFSLCGFLHEYLLQRRSDGFSLPTGGLIFIQIGPPSFDFLSVAMASMRRVVVIHQI
jgi:hypothetical protein